MTARRGGAGVTIAGLVVGWLLNEILGTGLDDRIVEVCAKRLARYTLELVEGRRQLSWTMLICRLRSARSSRLPCP